ncbi:hypothetical protein ACKLNO_06915 [Neisseriaceae bacterium B1]
MGWVFRLPEKCGWYFCVGLESRPTWCLNVSGSLKRLNILVEGVHPTFSGCLYGLFKLLFYSA